MGCSLHDNRLHCSVAIFFCPVLQFRGFDVTSERGLYTRSQNPLRKLLKTVCLALPAVLEKLLLARLYWASKERPRRLLRSVHGHRYGDVSDFLIAFLHRHSSVPQWSRDGS